MRKFMSRWFRNSNCMMRGTGYLYVLGFGLLFGSVSTHLQLKVMPARDLFFGSVAVVIMMGLSHIVAVTAATFFDRLAGWLRMSPRSAPMKTAAKPSSQPPDQEAEAELERLKARVRESWARLNDPQYEEMTVRAPVDPNPNAPGGDC